MTECCPEIKNWCLSPRARRFVCLKLRIKPHRRLCRAPLGCRCSNQVRHRGSGGRHPSGLQPRMLQSSSLSSIELGETSCRPARCNGFGNGNSSICKRMAQIGLAATLPLLRFWRICTLFGVKKKSKEVALHPHVRNSSARFLYSDARGPVNLRNVLHVSQALFARRSGL